jgi:hypothetical protein
MPSARRMNGISERTVAAMAAIEMKNTPENIAKERS